jgi:4-amino-4-deoxy-L-arabinose transferase-like glycosyltransferase
VGASAFISLDEKMANANGAVAGAGFLDTRKNWHLYVAILLISGAIYLGCSVSPPSLVDDSDSVVAQAARTMLQSGDWVTARLDGIPFLEKPPLFYWPIALSFKIFGVHDWSARVPIALAAMGVALLTTAMGIWAFGKRAGFYAGLCMSTCIGLFLFTRVLIPDVLLVFTIALTMWAFLRALDEDEPHPRLWAAIFAASVGVGLLIKSLISVIFPVGAGVIYLLLTHQFFSARTWKRLHPFSGAAIALLIAVPWHVLAMLRNPPYFSLSFHSGPGEYHGFLWFFFINEQLLRFLNLRYPRDYNTVPRVYFWLFHLLWLFPWSVYLPAVAKLSFRPLDRAGKMRLLALCWTGFLLTFFTFSTTQEYYSMPCYPALALLLGSAMAAEGEAEKKWIRRGTYVLCGIAAAAAIVTLTLFFLVRNVAAPGDISTALSQHPKAYTLSLGHMEDLTIQSFAYLRAPLLFAAIAFLIGAIGAFRSAGLRAFLSASLMMVLFFHAARLAMVTFDPYLSSRPLADALLRAPEGKLIIARPYYTFASVFFYTNRTALILNGRINNLEYASYAPGVPQVFIEDAQFQSLWLQPQRYYVLALDSQMPKLESLVGRDHLIVLASSGGKSLLTNQPVAAAASALQTAPVARISDSTKPADFMYQTGGNRALITYTVGAADVGEFAVSEFREFSAPFIQLEARGCRAVHDFDAVALPSSS